MRILVLNPNTTEAVTDLMVEAGTAVAAAGTELVPMTATQGLPYLSSRAEAQIGGVMALEMIAAMHGQVDAAIIAAFGDPGLLGARELFDLPVIGISEAFGTIYLSDTLGSLAAYVIFVLIMLFRPQGLTWSSSR